MKKIKFITIIALLIAFTLSSCKNNEVSEISLNKQEVTMYIGDTFGLVATIYATSSVSNFPKSYVTSDPKVAKIDESGVIVALQVGDAEIIVNAGGKSARCLVHVVENTLNFTLAKLNYWGDFYSRNAHVFDLYLFENGVSTNRNGDIVGNGYFLYLDMNSTTANTYVESGTYNAGTDGSAFTFQKGKMGKNSNNEDVPTGSYIAEMVNDEVVNYLFINSGSVEVSYSGEYKIVGSVTTDNNQNININYRGNLSSTDMVTPRPSTLSKGALWYWGDAENNGLHLFSIRLGNDNVKLNSFDGGGDRMILEMFTTTAHITDIPTGNFVVNRGNPMINTFIAGYSNEKKENFGSWYYTEVGFQIVSGSVTISKTANVYSITYDLMTNNNLPIGGKYSGTLGYANQEKNTNNVQRKQFPQKREVEEKRVNIRYRRDRNLR